MQGIKDFLESSTIHGLTYISTTKKIVKLFWIFVVIFGFTGAGVLIYQSFEAWAQSPVSTIVETMPISKITFPKVTVCPPKNTYTNLNYDLTHIVSKRSKQPENETKSENEDLKNHALQLLYDLLHNQLMRNLSKLNDDNRYYNWYHGHTNVDVPYPNSDINSGPMVSTDLYYKFESYALSGNISTPDFYINTMPMTDSQISFDQMFEKAENLEPDIFYDIIIYSHDDFSCNKNITLNLQLQKKSLKELSSGFDKFSFVSSDCSQTSFTDKKLNQEAHLFENYSPSGSSKTVKLYRKAPNAVENVQTASFYIPGFDLKWHYTGLDENITERGYYYNNNNPITRLFIRN